MLSSEPGSEAKQENMDKLSASIDEGQKRNLIHNLLKEVRKDGVLERDASNRRSTWRLAKAGLNPEN